MKLRIPIQILPSTRSFTQCSFECVHSALLNVYRALLSVYMALLNVYRALLSESRSLQMKLYMPIQILPSIRSFTQGSFECVPGSFACI